MTGEASKSQQCPSCGREVVPIQGCCPFDGTVLILGQRADALIGRTVAGRWVLDSLIGTGGFSMVFRARDLRTGSLAAAKILDRSRLSDQNQVARFINESKLLSRLRHPKLVPALDTGHDPEAGWFIAMPLLCGRTLAQRIAAGGACALQEVQPIVQDVLRALDYIHREGVVHRDIKTENVFLVDEGPLPGDPAAEALILDLGVAKVIAAQRDQAGELSAVTRPRQVVGSAWSMAPEQILADPVDGRTDLYSFGVLLFEVLAGRPPFQADRPGLVMRAHVHEPAPPPSEHQAARWLPRSADQFVLDLLAKDPAKRPPTAQAVLTRWEALQPELAAAWQRHLSDLPPGP